MSHLNVRSEAEFDTKAFRRVLGHFGTGVTILSTLVEGDVRGMTANAFLSGSLQPPLVVVSIARNAKLHHHLVHSNLLGISILNATQEPVSRHFAGQLSEAVSPRFEFHCGVPVLAD